MPHQCVRCGKMYEDASQEIIKGCSCGAKMFYFIKAEKYKQLKEKTQVAIKLTPEERGQIEEDVYDIIGDEIDRDKPVILDIESIEILQPGKYNLDLVKLFHEKQPLVYKLEDGKYFVDVIETFQRLRDKDKEKKRR
jgi:predicted  nucleic acid-binding Zn-ribbon protein